MRKLTQIGRLSVEQLTAQRRAMRDICIETTHPNIVTVLREGLLDEHHYHFMDIEFCEINLRAYIYEERTQTLRFSDGDTNNHVYVSIDSPPLMKMFNVWTIMNHITSGLNFIHLHECAHRYLSPQTGIYLYDH